MKGGPKYLAVYELESVEVIRSDAFVEPAEHRRGTSGCRRG